MNRELNPEFGVSFLVHASKAIFTDPITKTGGERHTYPVPTYEALRGVLESVYWKPTIRWVIDRVRVMTPIQKEAVALRLPKYTSDKIDRSYNTYLTDVAYQVQAHFEWSNLPGYEGDRNPGKHRSIALRSIARGGRYDVYLGSRECQAYVEPCVFGDGPGAYDHTPTVSFGLMYHGYTYPNMCGESKLYARFWDAVMDHGIINFPAPEDCKVVRFIRPMEPTHFQSDTLNETDDTDTPPSEIPADLATPAILQKEYPVQPSGDKRSWAAKLVQTYDNLSCADLEPDKTGVALLYPGHIIKPAQFEVTLNGDGELVPDGIRIVPEDEENTVIPCSVTSQFRTVQKDPHLLFDFLEYLAGDYPNYFTDSGSSHERYMAQLDAWRSSEARHPFVDIIYSYLSQGTLMSDLIQADVLPFLSDRSTGNPLPKWPKDAGSGLVRFKIQIDGMDPEIWKEKSLWECACKFNHLQTADKPQDICYATGEMAWPAPLHPYLRGTTKLISCNDKTDFTYRFGIRDLPQDCLQISYIGSQKIHLALRWLLAHQSFHFGGQTYLVWSIRNTEIPKLLYPGPSIPEPVQNTDVTASEYAQLVREFTLGITQNIPSDDEVVMMSLASPSTGRISITQYETIAGSKFFANLHDWYSSTVTRLPVKGGLELRSPTPFEVADVACGASQSPAERENVVNQTLRAMILGAPISRNLIKAMISSVTSQFSSGGVGSKINPAFYKPLNITVGVVRKCLNDLSRINQSSVPEVYDMSLNKEILDRGYLLGRLLAYYYKAENLAQYISGNGYRTTNAERLMVQYQDRPAYILKILGSRFIPYQNRLKKTFYGRNFLSDMDSFIASIPLDFLTDDPLSESFILGYHAQLNEFAMQKNQ